MPMIAKLTLAAAPLLLSVGAGHAQTAPATPDAGAKVAGMFDAPPLGKGQIIFYRPKGAGMISCPVREGEGAGEVQIAKLTGNHYFVLSAQPGAHQYRARSKSKDRLNIEVEEGETYFVKCTIALAMFGPGSPNLAPSDAAEFETVKAEMKPVEKGD